MPIAHKDVAELQKRIDAVPWYHEFDFGNGLHARSVTSNTEDHRRFWNFIQQRLDQIDFRGKTVLDIGSWDGYWSFYAEKRGAKTVLATDDLSQNWSDGTGIYLAKELLGSSIHINQHVSVYELASLKEQFDIILYLGVYYHLFDPFFAFAQIRHCCHPQSLVVIEGPIGVGLTKAGMLYNYADHNCEVLPTLEALQQITQATYFQEQTCDYLNPPELTKPQVASSVPLSKKWRWHMCQQVIKGSREGIKAHYLEVYPEPEIPVLASNRIILTSNPYSGENPLHHYKPPFGLHQYDPRFTLTDGIRRQVA